VAAVRADAYVGVIDSGAGFFPFQRRGEKRGEPIGGGRSNYHGVIADPDLDWDARRLVVGCGLRAWEFDHLLAAQPQFRGYVDRVGGSPYMDLSGGFEAYARRRGEDGSRVIKRLRQQERRIEREVGALRFEAHASDPEVLRLMMRWKSQQYRATGSEDRFAVRWNVELLERIHSHQTDRFAGLLPALYAEDRVIAVAMCMRAASTVHYWFPAYDQSLASFSPGMLLLLRLAESSADLGIDLLDLGKGAAPYKERLATGAIEITEGAVVTGHAAAALRGLQLGVVKRVQGSALDAPARMLARTVRSIRGLRRGG
jgi:CelD/BcsL family acetyltransferase involved in cellulose biosynthesis